MNTPQAPRPESARGQLTLADLLAQLDNLQALQLDPEVELVELGPGDVLFEEGDAGDSMYLVMSGALGVRVKQPDGMEAVIDRLAPGATVGELSLLSGQPRTATVFAIDSAGLIRLSRSKFEQLGEVEQRQLVNIETTAAARWQRLQLATVLGGLFGEMSASELHALQSKLLWQHLSSGDVLFRQGDKADGMYIVVNGRLRIIVESGGRQEPRHEVTAGETIGEWALLTDEPRSATVVAVRETDVVYLSKPVFEQLIHEKPEWMRKIALIIVQRQQQSFGKAKITRPSTLNIALIPANSSVDIERFTRDLVTTLDRFGPTLALDSRQFDKLYGQAGAAQTTPDAPEYPAITAWIGKLETDNSHLLFVSDGTVNPWTQRCINQADRVLIVGYAQDDPTPGAAEQLIGKSEVPVRTELVLLHAPDTQFPQGTIRWLEPRSVLHHHHVRLGDAGHVARLVRRLTGNAIGLALSGGSALGYAHQGVYKALLELDIPLDYIGGVSMGSIMGGMMATTYSYDRYEMHAAQSVEKGIFDYTLPIASLARSKNVMEILQGMFGTFEIEDLWIPYFCVSANLTTADLRIHRQGSMWRAIRASMSIPGIFVPVVEEGEVLVDGGIMDNFPAATLAEFIESDRLIGVVVTPFKEKKREYDYDYHLSGWRVLRNRLNPFSKPLRVPSFAKTLIWSMEINGRRVSRAQQEAVDLLITPDVRQFSVTDYDRWRELVQAGYDAALEPLRAWKAERLPFL